jgi:hypothetical protein
MLSDWQICAIAADARVCYRTVRQYLVGNDARMSTAATIEAAAARLGYDLSQRYSGTDGRPRHRILLAEPAVEAP